jgi:hypothetical protein
MNRRSVVLTVLPAVVISGFALATTSSARLVTAEPVGAVTTIRAAHSGSAELVLYDDATISPRVTGNPDVKITGRGLLLGFELRRADGGSDNVSGVRMPAFAGGGVRVSGSFTPQSTCTSSDPLGVQSSCTYPNPTAIVLHEGYYHLVALTDGAPITITLRLHGESQRRAAVHIQHSLRTLEASLPERESMGSSTVTFGADVPFAAATQAFMVVGARLHPAATVLASSTCTRSDTAAPPPYAFSPACPGGRSAGLSYQIGSALPVGRQGGIAWFGVPSPSGSTNGLGGSLVDSDGPTYVGGVGVWIAGDELQSLGGWGPVSN